MAKKYEYTFVRLGEGYLSVKKEGKEKYQQIVLQYAEDGWRLVQVFAPSLGIQGMSKFFELIFEREKL